MSMGQFANQAMGAQQAQLSSHGSGAAAGHLCVPRLTHIEEVLNVAVTEASDRPLAAAQGAKQEGVNAQRLECAIASSVVGQRTAKRADHLSQWSAPLRAGQCIQIPFVGRTADFGPTRQITDSPAQGLPGALRFLLWHASVNTHSQARSQAFGCRGGTTAGRRRPASRSLGRGLGAKNREGLRPVDRVFHTQQVPEFVIGFLSIEASHMLNTNSFMASQHVAAHVPSEASVHSPGFDRHVVAQKAHHVRALEGAQAVDDKGTIGTGQIALVTKEQVGGVLTLRDGPVVEEIGKRFENLLPQWMSRCQQSVEQLQPVGLVLRVCQPLGTVGIGQFNEAVVSPSIGQACGIHLLGQPQPTIETDIYAERIPGLQADVTTAHHRVFIVVIEVKTFALFAYRLEPPPVSGAAYGHSQARLDRAQYCDEAAFDLVALSNVLNELLLADLSGTQEMIRALGRSRPILGFLKEAMSQRLGMLGKVNQPDFCGTQIRTHPLRGKQWTEAGVEAKAIPTTQGALDQRAKLVHKAFGNEVFR